MRIIKNDKILYLSKYNIKDIKVLFFDLLQK